jgi:hypothetical protein
MSVKEITFVTDFKRLLYERNLTGMFALCKYPGDDFDSTFQINIGLAKHQPEAKRCTSSSHPTECRPPTTLI